MGACETVCGIVEAYPTEAQPAVVKVNPSAINTRIGVEIETGEMISILQSFSSKYMRKEKIWSLQRPAGVMM